LRKLNKTTNNLSRGITLQQVAATSTSLAIHRNRSSVVDTAIGYGLVGPGFDISPKRSDRLWGPPIVLLYEYRGSFSRKSGSGVKLTTHLHLVQRLRMSGATPPLMAWSRKNLTCQFARDRRYKQCKEWLTACTVLCRSDVSRAPRRYPCFDVVVGLVWSHDPKSYAGSSVCYW
jgi:hypothetical protein